MDLAVSAFIRLKRSLFLPGILSMPNANSYDKDLLKTETERHRVRGLIVNLKQVGVKWLKMALIQNSRQQLLDIDR